MDYYVDIYNIRRLFRGENILNKKYILYGLGISNQKIKEYFDLNNVLYNVFIDNVNNINDIELNDIDYVVKSSGIKFDTPFLKKVEEFNIKIISDLELYCLLNINDLFIIITGTNGKTTTVSLISDILNISSYGNIGNSIFNKTLNNDLNYLTLVETSSFMLHNTYSIKPFIYVITNLEEHHLDYHKTVENYFYDKTKLIPMSKYFICNYKYMDMFGNYQKIFTFSIENKLADIYVENNYIIYNDTRIINVNELKINEPHNIENIMIAILVSIILNIDLEIIKEKIKNFNGLQYRLEKIIDNERLVVINDSKSTSPYSLSAGIYSLIGKYALFKKILIIGGKLVDSNYDAVNKVIDYFDEVCIFGYSCFEIEKLLHHHNIKKFKDLKEVVDNIKTFDNVLILFSPSQPSYDQYKNYIERGRHFNHLIFYHNFCI